MTGKKKRKGEAADPFAEEMAAIEAKRREEHRGDWTPPEQKAGPPIAESKLHSHDAGCWAGPWLFRSNGASIEAGRTCLRFGQWVPDHYATPDELKDIRDPAQRKTLGLGAFQR